MGQRLVTTDAPLLQAVQEEIRSHDQRVLPVLLDTLEFRSDNAAHQPIIQARALLKR